MAGVSSPMIIAGLLEEIWTDPSIYSVCSFVLP